MRRAMRLLMPLIAAFLATIVGALVAPTAAHADGPTAVHLTGPGLTEHLRVLQTGNPDLFADLLAEVTWLAGRSANAPTPDPARLGPQYVLVVFVNGVPQQQYELYPMASGGPRVFRPAAQPNKTTVAAAWFYGRVSLPETMQAVGVPLNLPGGVGAAGGGAGAGGTGGGGRGGGEVIEIRAPGTTPPDASLGQVLGVWQRQILLMGAGALVLLVLIGGVARLVRRKI